MESHWLYYQKAIKAQEKKYLTIDGNDLMNGRNKRMYSLQERASN